MMKKVVVDGVKILEEVYNFFEKVKNDEDYKALMAKYEIEKRKFLVIFRIFNLQSSSLRQRNEARSPAAVCCPN